MILEELKQIYFSFRLAGNNFLSRYFNDGEMISVEEMNVILFGIIFVLLFIFFCARLWYRKMVLKSKPIEKLTEKEKEELSDFLEKEKVKRTELKIKEEKKLLEKKELRELAKSEEQEKALISKINVIQEERRDKKILNRDLEKVIETDESFEKGESFFERLRKGIGNTRRQFLTNMSNVVLGKKEIDGDLLDDLEEVLIGSDIGPETTIRIIESITEKVERKELTNPQVLKFEIKQEIQKIMSKTYPTQNYSESKPLILLFVGVNGVGKTTTIGKFAAKYRKQGKKVLLGAGDTFRAAAIDQLVEWSVRAECEILRKDPKTDPSAVIHDSVQKGIDEGFDVVICDTAGRLHTKKNLMEELKKMVRVIRKLIPEAPHEIFLVLDATTGQNAIFQTREFKEATELTGLIITKLDGTSKGGVVIGIVNEFDIPVRYIGIGEQIEDLRPFDSKQFTESIFD